jgi:hypothetical protein
LRSPAATGTARGDRDSFGRMAAELVPPKCCLIGANGLDQMLIVMRP